MAKARRIGGYAKHTSHTRAELTDGKGKVIGRGEIVSCTRIRPGERGSWISNERCSYRFKVGNRWYYGRGYGNGMSVSLRPYKRRPS